MRPSAWVTLVVAALLTFPESARADVAPCGCGGNEPRTYSTPDETGDTGGTAFRAVGGGASLAGGLLVLVRLRRRR